MCSHPRCTERKVCCLMYVCALTGDVRHVRLTLKCLGVLSPTRYGTYGFLCKVRVCSHQRSTARKIPSLMYGCAHTHNVWHVRFRLYHMGVPTQTHKWLKRMLFIRTKHNTRCFGVIPLKKLQKKTCHFTDCQFLSPAHN